MKNQLMTTSLGLLMLAALSLAATSAQAGWDRGGRGYRHDAHAYTQSQAYGQRIDARQERQMERIRAGIHNGSLTRPEFRDLMHEQREIRAMEHHFRTDGIIDAREYQHLDRALDRASRRIRAERHDHQARYAYNGTPPKRHAGR
ncbi:MAG: hypothetical protein ACM3KD_02470 [Hyphomicrobiaceae bacterium]